MSTEYYEFPCIEFTQGDLKLYSFKVDSKLLWSFLQINKRQEDKREGYQRALSPSRVKSIADYIDSGKVIPNSIIISLGSAEFDDGVLKIPKGTNAGWVIDGQHRLAGAFEANTTIELNVIAFLDINIDEQINQFITINKEAKGVPSSLYIDLLPHLENKTPLELAKERCADLASMLRRDESSPFFNRIVITTSPKKGQISLTNFVRKITPLITRDKGIFGSFSERNQRTIIYNYYSGIKNVYADEFKKEDSIFFKTIGFGGMINALPVAFSLGLNHFKGFTVDNVISLFKKIDQFEFDDWRKLGTGSSAEIQAGDDIKTELNAAFATKEDDDSSLNL